MVQDQASIVNIIMTNYLFAFVSAILTPCIHAARPRSQDPMLGDYAEPLRSHKCRPSDPESFPVVYAAFYLWYGNPETDGKWIHWNHITLPHWDKHIDAQHPRFNWNPPAEAHAPFRPLKGLYSSANNETLIQQFQEMADAGIDVAVTSWWGQANFKGKRDDADSGANTDLLMNQVLAAAEKSGVKVAIHVEPYGERNAWSVKDDIKYIHETYGHHPALYRRRRKDLSATNIYDPKWSGPSLPVFFLYDVSAQHVSRQDEKSEWRNMITEIRGSKYDGVLYGLYIGI